MQYKLNERKEVAIVADGNMKDCTIGALRGKIQ
jgi:hypothetical protein